MQKKPNKAWIFCDNFYINISLARKWFTLAQLIIVQTFMSGIASSVADSYSFFADPDPSINLDRDPGVDRVRIRIHELGY